VRERLAPLGGRLLERAPERADPHGCVVLFHASMFAQPARPRRVYRSSTSRTLEEATFRTALGQR